MYDFEQLLFACDIPRSRSRDCKVLRVPVSLPFVDTGMESSRVGNEQNEVPAELRAKAMQKDQVIVPCGENYGWLRDLFSELEKEFQEGQRVIPRIRTRASLGISRELATCSAVRTETYHWNAVLTKASGNAKPGIEHVHYDRYRVPHCLFAITLAEESALP